MAYEQLLKEKWTFVEPAETEDKYPVPSAFAAYTGYLNIKQGIKKYKEESIERD